MRRARRRFLVLAAAMLAVAAGTALFRVSQQVQEAEDRAGELSRAVVSEQEAIRVLNAEWDYLNRPDRIEQLAQEHLHMRLPQVKQMEGSAADLPETFTPPQEEKADIETQPAAVEINTAPAPTPSAKPARAAPQRDFNRMLDDLAPAAGGER